MFIFVPFFCGIQAEVPCLLFNFTKFATIFPELVPDELDPAELAFPSVAWILGCHERASAGDVFHFP